MRHQTTHILDALHQCGLDTDDPIQEDDQLHRIHILGDKPGTKNGWYITSPTGGCFGSWKESVTHIWRSGERLTPAQERQMDEVYQVNRKKAESQKKKRYANNLKYLKLARKESAPITDESASLARIYLKHRLHTELETLPDNLRFHSSMYCKDSKPLPVMLAVITGPDGQPVGMHRTYLSKDGHKAPIPSPKMIMPAHKDNALRGAAIRLYEPDQTLIVAEGIETALSLHLMTGEPCWACISATGLQNVVIPETVKNILIGADNDEAGMRVARNLGKRLVNEGHEVTIRMPSEPGADWNDHLVKERA